MKTLITISILLLLSITVSSQNISHIEVIETVRDCGDDDTGFERHPIIVNPYTYKKKLYIRWGGYPYTINAATKLWAKLGYPYTIYYKNNPDTSTIHLHNKDWNCGMPTNEKAILLTYSDSSQMVIYDFEHTGFVYKKPYEIAIKHWRKEKTKSPDIKEL